MHLTTERLVIRDAAAADAEPIAELWADAETIFLVPEVSNSFISSSLVREVAKLGGDVSSFVSPSVLEQMRLKLA